MPEGGEGCDPLFDLRGYAPSIYTKVGVLQGDYLPVSHHASVSTHPLAGAGGVFHGPLSTATRPALNDVVDLITGQPLIRESDFELPFGTTVFRHIRTYSQIPMFTRESSDAMDYPTGTGPFESGLWWDVTGYGWMVGHSPLLLIDAAYAGWDTGEPYDGEAQNHIERCIFLPDAHRAIPFMSLGEDGRYEAPPRFDAVLSHNGDPADFESNSGDRHHWEEFPTEWNVWLQNRGLKYTMKPVYDDMQVNSSGVSLNQYPPPATQSHLYGRPFYGVATRIEDPQGNRIEIDYCSFEQKPCGSSSDGCANCCQACSAKGTIDQVRLVVGGASNESPEIVYRLVYVYREGSTFAVSAHDTGYPDMTQPVLHEIYVLPGDVEVDPGCRTIEREVFDAILDEYEFEGEAMECFAELSQITWADQPGVTDEWLDEWVIRVRYSYVDDHAFFQDLDYDGCASSGPWNGMEPRLVQASVTTRAVDPNIDEEWDDTPKETTQHTVYRYRWDYLGAEFEQGQLRAIYDHDALEQLRSEVLGSISDSELKATVDETWPAALHAIPDTEVFQVDGNELIASATLQLEYWGDLRAGRLDWMVGTASGGAEDFWMSDFHAELVDEYLTGVSNDPCGTATAPARPEQPVLKADGPAVVIDRRAGGERSYRVHRFLVMPTDVDLVPKQDDYRPDELYPCNDANNDDVVDDEEDTHTRYPSSTRGYEGGLSRALLHEPYLFRDNSYPHTNKPSSLATPVWIAVVDEYESYDAVIDQGMETVGGWTAVAEATDVHKIPLTRRVVMMNAAGVVLSEREFNLRNGEENAEGMWEQFVYDWQDSDWETDHPGVPAIGRLLQHRTYGWSVAAAEETDPEDAAAGLVRVFEYDIGGGASNELKKSLLPSKAGIMWGTNVDGSGDPDDLVWLTQVVRDPKRPDLIVHEVEFLTETAGQDPLEGIVSPANLATEMASGKRIVTHAYLEDTTWRGDGEDPPSDFQPPVIAKLTIEPPAKASPGGTDVWPIGISYTNLYWGTEGGSGVAYRPGDRDVWTGVGAATNAGITGGKVYSIDGDGRAVITFDPTSADHVSEFYASVERSFYDGKTVMKAVDVDLEADTSGEAPVATTVYDALVGTMVTSESNEWWASIGVRAPMIVPFWDMDGQEPWVRRSSNVPALQHWSYIGPTSQATPRFTLDYTGKQMRVFTNYVDPDDEGPLPTHLETETCDALYPVAGPMGPVLRAFAPGVVTEEHNGVATVSKKVRWPATGFATWINYSNEDDVISRTEIGSDSSGRPNSITVTDVAGSGGQSLEQEVVYGRFGEVSREKHPDGTIIRNIADERGRRVRVYKGSEDDATYWGGSGGDDMILVEKRAYGAGFADANLLVETRNYRTKPADQYVPAGEVNDLDDEGYATRVVYDWRGRALVTKTISGADTVVRQEVVFRDHSDNVLLTATYGATHGWGTDESLPTLLPDSDPLPSALDVLGEGGELIALESRTYNLRGQIEVVTTYDVADDSGDSFLATKTYSDFAGRVVWSQSNGNVVTRNVQDPKGRQILTSTAHDSTELTRTETAYTDRDQPFRVKTYERRHDELASTDPLDDENAIVTYRFTWYDHAGRVRAVADTGTGDDKSMANFALDDVDAEDTADGFDWDFSDEVGWIDHTEFDDVAFFEDSENDPECRVPGWLPVTARISSFAYDESGNQIVSVDPMGAVTRSRYNGFGQLVLQWENAARDLEDEPADDSRLTATSYNGAEVARVGVLVDSTEINPAWFDLDEAFDLLEDLPWTGGDMLVSRVGTGAVVTDGLPPTSDGAAITPAEPSFAGSSVAWIDYPTTAELDDPNDPGTPHDVKYTYYADGLLATRTDERGVIFKYYYDHAGRLTTLLADESNCTTYLHNNTPPKDRIDKIEFEYHAAKGHLLSATAIDRDGGPTSGSTTISAGVFDYDSRGNLVSETQYHAAADIPTFDPTIWYTWDYHAADDVSGTANVDRLTEITYPMPVPDGMSTMNRLFTLSYGTAGTATDALSLVTSVSEADAGFLAAFEYTGAGRRVAFNRGGSSGSPTVRSSVFGNPIAGWDQGGSPSATDYDGLSPFGEVRALAYWRILSGPTTEVLAAQRYAYDAAGRRTAAWHQHAPVAPLSGPAVGTNERSQHFGYDSLGRLIQADMGLLTGPLAGTSVEDPPIWSSGLMPLARRVGWDLDARDVWGVRTEIFDENEDRDGADTGADESASVLGHRVGTRNELTAYVDPGATINVMDRFVNDASGNLILDDERFYEYDAWGRLMKVSERGTLDLEEPGVGQEPELTGAPGDWLVHYTYDGVGRMIRKQTPIRLASGVNAGTQTGLRTERYYYDGSRRIQEVIADTISAADPDPLDGGILIEEEMELLDEGESGGGSSGPVLSDPAYVGREYVYVPSAADGYVDEFICQFDRYGDIWWLLQDVNFNVIAMTDVDGDVVQQTLYDPYGEALFVEDYAAHPGSKIGHQGLFFDRLEPPAPVSGGTVVSLGAATQLSPGVFGVYQMPGMGMLPRYGRTAQSGMRDTGVVLPLSDRTAGMQVWNVQPDPTNTLDLMGTGLNRFSLTSKTSDPTGFVRLMRPMTVPRARSVFASAPPPTLPPDPAPTAGAPNRRRRDDPFDWISPIIAEHLMSTAGIVDRLIGEAKAGSVKSILYTQAAFLWDDMIMDRDEGTLLSMVLGPFGGRACFEEGTLVWTSEGPVPIEALSLGDEVISRPDPELESGEAFEVPLEPGSLSLVRLRYTHADGSVTMIETLRPTSLLSAAGMVAGRSVRTSILELGIEGDAEVLGVNRYTEAVRADVPILTSRFVTDAAAVVDLYLEGQEKPIGVTPNHRVFSADRGTWIEAGELRAGERLASAAPVGDAEAAGQNVLVVARVEPREERVRVYNLEVSRYHTYFVGDQGVWVHNGCVPDEVKASPKLFKNWMQSKARTAFQNGSFIAKADLDEIVGVARTMGLKIGRVEQGVTGTVGKVWHIHIGGYHVPCPPNYTP